MLFSIKTDTVVSVSPVLHQCKAGKPAGYKPTLGFSRGITDTASMRLIKMFVFPHFGLRVYWSFFKTSKRIEPYVLILLTRIV